MEDHTMCNRHWIFVAGLLACGCVALQFASRLAAQQNDSAVKSDKDSANEKERKDEHELDLRYAKAYLRLMEATLDRYQDANRIQPNSIPPELMQVIQDCVREAGLRAQLAQKGGITDAEICVSDAEARLSAAQESLRKAEAANGVSPGAVGAPRVEQLKADVELAKVRVQKAHNLAAESPVANLHFELEQLREDVRQLQMYVALLRIKQ
jgi:hypothetical protein